MKVAGVIAEFDPFHNGHAYFLRRVRGLTSADFIIAVMSGDFTQRGNAAIAGKRLRAEAALLNGADIVMELPMQYATASAETFALGGVAILDSLGVVDTLCFGTEETDIEPLHELAGALSYETDEFKERIGLYLREGMNYPAARMEALKDITSRGGGSGIAGERLTDIMSRPNNILAVEYLKACIAVGSAMDAVNVKREAVDHDSSNSYGIYSSAKNIRKILRETRSLDAVSVYLPEASLPLMREHFDVDFPMYDGDLSLLMRYRLLMEDEDSLMRYADMNSELAHRIINRRNEFMSVSQFTELLKTRNLTYTRISRALLHVLLSVTKEDMGQYMSMEKNNRPAAYARLLGFRKEASSLMEEIRDNALIPVISRTSDYKTVLKGRERKMFADTLRSSDIYHAVIKDIYDTAVPSDISIPAAANEVLVLN